VGVYYEMCVCVYAWDPRVWDAGCPTTATTTKPCGVDSERATGDGCVVVVVVVVVGVVGVGRRHNTSRSTSSS